jgi:hypothetical protein
MDVHVKLFLFRALGPLFRDLGPKTIPEVFVRWAGENMGTASIKRCEVNKAIVVITGYFDIVHIR